MSTTIYTINLGHGELNIKTDLANPKAMIYYQETDQWIYTGYRAGQFNTIREIAVRVISVFDDAFWLATDASLEKNDDGELLIDGLDQDDYIERMIVSIEKGNEEGKDGY